MIRKQTKRWTMRDGTKIRICDMTDSHVTNTIRMLERVARKHHPKLIASMYSCLGMIHGEMAEMDLENAIASLEEGGEYGIMPSIYDSLVLDAERRGLKIG